jgi:chromosome segregation ATPase
MIKIHPLILMFLIQFLLIFLTLSIILIVRRKKGGMPEETLEEMEKLKSELEEYRNAAQMKGEEVQRWKKMFDEIRSKFEEIKNANEKMKQSLAALFPEAKKSAEYKKMIESFEKHNKELDLCIDTLNGVNKELLDKTKSLKNETDKLSRRLEASVSKAEYERVVGRMRSLENKYNRIKEQLEDKERQYEKLHQDYTWLEKEYNALYDNIEEKQKVS